MEFKNKDVCRHLHFGAHLRSQCCGCSSLNYAQCSNFGKCCAMWNFVLQNTATVFSPNLSNLPPFENFVHYGNLLQFCAMAMFCKLCAIWRFCTCYAMWHFCVQCGNLLRITHSLVTLAKVAQCGISFCKFCKILRFFAKFEQFVTFCKSRALFSIL